MIIGFQGNQSIIDTTQSEMILPESSYNNPVFPRLKPWKEFFSKFSLPTRKNILQRLEDNVLYFQTNYLIVGALCLLLSV